MQGFQLKKYRTQICIGKFQKHRSSFDFQRNKIIFQTENTFFGSSLRLKDTMVISFSCLNSIPSIKDTIIFQKLSIKLEIFVHITDGILVKMTMIPLKCAFNELTTLESL